LGHTPRGGFQTIAALPGNIKAIEAGHQFASGIRTSVAIIGPSGWGKTHLLAITRESLEAIGINAEFTSALAWINSSNRMDSQTPLLLDDVQDVLRHPRARHQFRLAIERRIRSRRPTMLCFTGHRMTHGIRTALPLGREWTVATVTEPTPDERELVVRQIAQTERMLLARPIVRMISHHLHGNGHSVSGALQRLKMFRDDWTRDDDVCAACGVLSPYLLGRDGWDARDEVSEAVSRVIREDRELATDITAYLMHQVIGLTEGDVATFLRITPSNVYSRSVRVAKGLVEPEMSEMVRACKSAVLQSFDRV